MVSIRTSDAVRPISVSFLRFTPSVRLLASGGVSAHRRSPNCYSSGDMVTASFKGAAQFIPDHLTMRKLQLAVNQCRGCDLYRYAKQAVLGEGPVSSRVMLVGEQPGNEEDIQGRPFVGPAGKLLDRALT